MVCIKDVDFFLQNKLGDGNQVSVIVSWKHEKIQINKEGLLDTKTQGLD
jgi:hypothetical protein